MLRKRVDRYLQLYRPFFFPAENRDVEAKKKKSLLTRLYPIIMITVIQLQYVCAKTYGIV